MPGLSALKRRETYGRAPVASLLALVIVGCPVLVYLGLSSLVHWLFGPGIARGDTDLYVNGIGTGVVTLAVWVGTGVWIHRWARPWALRPGLGSPVVAGLIGAVTIRIISFTIVTAISVAAVWIIQTRVHETRWKWVVGTVAALLGLYLLCLGQVPAAARTDDMHRPAQPSGG